MPNSTPIRCQSSGTKHVSQDCHDVLNINRGGFRKFLFGFYRPKWRGVKGSPPVDSGAIAILQTRGAITTRHAYIASNGIRDCLELGFHQRLCCRM